MPSLAPLGDESEEPLLRPVKRRRTATILGYESAEDEMVLVQRRPTGSHPAAAAASCPLPFVLHRPLQDEPAEGGGGSASSSSGSESEAEGCQPVAKDPPPSWRVVGLGFDAFVKAEVLSNWRKLQQGCRAQLAEQQKRPYNNKNRRQAATARGSLKARVSHRQNGCDPVRIGSVLKRPCQCTRSCFSAFKASEVTSFLKKYWSLDKGERDALLHLVLLPDGLSDQPVLGAETRTHCQWTFLNHRISLVCLAQLVGHNKRKLLKAATAFDGRVATGRALNWQRHAEVDAFFTTLYHSVAEPLPTQCALRLHVRRERICHCMHVIS